MAAMTRGLRLPCSTAMINNGFSSGAYLGGIQGIVGVLCF